MMRRLVPDQVTEKRSWAVPAALPVAEPLACAVAFSSTAHDSGVVVSVESVESPEDRNYRRSSFAEYGDTTLLAPLFHGRRSLGEGGRDSALEPTPEVRARAGQVQKWCAAMPLKKRLERS